MNEKCFIALSGINNSHKSTVLKSALLDLAKAGYVNSCAVKLAVIDDKGFNYCDSIVDSDKKSDKDLMAFLKKANKGFTDIRNNTDDISNYEKCIRLLFRDSHGAHEVDFVALVDINTKSNEKLKLGICTIGDDPSKIRKNVCYSRMNELNSDFKKADVIVCAERSDEAAVKCINEISENGNNGITSLLRIRVAKKETLEINKTEKQVALKKEKEYEIAIDIEDVASELLEKLKEGFGSLIEWAKKLSDKTKKGGD